MRTLLAALLLAVFTAPALLAHAQPADRLQLARAILDQAEPDASAVNVELRGWEAGVRAALRSVPAIEALESDIPGTIDAGVVAGRAVAVRHLPRIVKQIKAKRAAMIAEKLTLEELREFEAFVSSPVGKRFYQSIQNNVTPEDLAESIGDRASETGDSTITEADAGRAIRQTLSEAHEQLSSADTIAIMKFEQSSAGRKLSALAPEIMKMQLEIANKPDPEWMAEQDKAMTEAMIRFAEAKLGSR